MPHIEPLIVDSIHQLTEHPKFITWRESNATSSGDSLLINNSFIFRDVKTNKAATYLALLVKEQFADSEVVVASGARINVDFKRVAGTSGALPVCIPLAKAIEPQIE